MVRPRELGSCLHHSERHEATDAGNTGVVRFLVELQHVTIQKIVRMLSLEESQGSGSRNGADERIE
jgi:hypothetical protein